MKREGMSVIILGTLLALILGACGNSSGDDRRRKTEDNVRFEEGTYGTFASQGDYGGGYVPAEGEDYSQYGEDLGEDPEKRPFYAGPWTSTPSAPSAPSGGQAARDDAGVYTLIYKLEYGYRVDKGGEKWTYYTDGTELPPWQDAEKRENEEWANLKRPFFYVLFDPDPENYTDPICLCNYDFLTEGMDDEVISESPYDNPPGVPEYFDCYDEEGMLGHDNNRILGDTFEVSGIGSGGVTIRTQYDTGMVYVFSLYYDSRNDE